MDPLAHLVTGQILRVACYAGALVCISVFLNILNQLFFYRANEPPVVWHWIPFLGSTVGYGMDPYRFFFACREKVCLVLSYVVVIFIGMGIGASH